MANDVRDASLTVASEVTVLARRVRTLTKAATRAVDARLVGSSYSVLARISDAGPVRAKEIACHLGLDKSTVSRLLTNLEEIALVERMPDPVDRRAQRVRLTREGRRRVAAVRAVRGSAVRELLGSWSPADVTKFARLLERFNADAEEPLSTTPTRTATPTPVPHESKGVLTPG